MQAVTLEDKYVSDQGRIYLNGVQALVRLALIQRRRDVAAGLNTGGYISGYRGSPLGGLDKALWHAQPHLKQHHITFQPGVNEELAATAVWGSQQLHLIGESDYDGVFAMWYGKGPGVDRCGDVFKHMNFSGTAKYGGVLLVAGDDHGAYSSSLPHQSDHLFSASMIPVLYPANVEEYLELGLHGFAMSRFSGCAVGFKALADTVESSASIDADPFRIRTITPPDYVMPEGGLNVRHSSEVIGLVARKQEALMQNYKIYAALAYSRTNQLNRTVIDSPKARLGIICSGKSYMDVLEALEELGVSEQEAAQIGLRVFKVSMPWPLDPDGVRDFAQGLEEILVVEEKRQMVEYQLKEQLYNWRADVRPRVIGKFDEKGEWGSHPRGDWLLPATADFSIAQIARVIASRIARFHSSDRIKARLTLLEAKEAVLQKAVSTPPRPAYYCSGCPHNTSTKVPDGSLALAGIGCHVMAMAIYPEDTGPMCQMGGEGAPWIGQAPFSRRKHMFANLGDGTYFHSGHLSIRAALAADVNITYKILYNDAVAMTGGQPIDGVTSVSMIAHQVAAEGVGRIAVVTEDLERYDDRSLLPQMVTLHDRREMESVQRELRQYEGVSVLIYDQTCAAEKRRRRKKGTYPLATKRLVINEAVCEGCGDCGEQSNCVAILPLETEFGRKRTIDQSACNQDYSCVKGFCPSFVSIEGGTLRKPSGAQDDIDAGLPELPDAPLNVSESYNILITGIGGTGVLTIGALLGMAAHIENKGVSVLDMTGMSQKNGAVKSHVKFAPHPSAIHAQRIATGEADLILGCDMLTAASQDAISKTNPGRTVAVINSHQQPTGDFARNAQWQYPADAVRVLIEESVDGRSHFINGTQLATALLGDAIATNLFMLGYAFQLGLLPLKQSSIMGAIELNGVAIDSNKKAFEWGRRAAVNLDQVERIASPAKPVHIQLPQKLDDIVKRRVEFLTAYQNADYAKRYLSLVDKVRSAETNLGKGDVLSKTVARSYSKLLAYKDEYEVARLFTQTGFFERLQNEFEGNYKVAFHLAPPLIARPDPDTGIARKRRFGPWMRHVFSVLAKLKGLRGTRFDPFGYTAERRMERRLISEYETTLETLLQNLREDNYRLAVEIAGLPEQALGFGHVKQRNVAKTLQQRDQLLASFGADPRSPLKRAA
jgi:indolepyruvate ferredoxin oxidoreductase